MVAPQTICFVEDSDLDFELAQVAIRQVAPRAEVLRALSCHDAATVFAERVPALVFVDLNLPRCDGVEVLHILATSGQDSANGSTAAVVFTTSTNPEDRARALAAGARDFRSKPTDPRLFLTAVKEVVQTWLS